MLKNKKILSVFILFLMSINITLAGDYSSSPSYNLEYVDYLDFEAERNGEYVNMSWDKYDGENFAYYKLMRSESDSNPTYPKLSAYKVIIDVNYNEVKASIKSSSFAYYRVCLVLKVDGYKEIYCSDNVEKIEGYSNSNSNSSTSYTSSNSSDKYTLSSSMKIKANNLISNLKEQLNSKYDDDNEKIEKLEELKTKLEKVGEQSTKYSDLIDYLIEKIDKLIEEYDDSFYHYNIESLFDDI